MYRYKIVANVERTFAWIPPHGRKMSSGESYYWYGNVLDFHTRFTPNVRAINALRADVWWRRVTITSEVLSSSVSA